MTFEAHSTDYQTPHGVDVFGRRRMAGAQGRAGTDLRDARGAVRTGRHRERTGGARRPVAAARGRRAPHARRARALGTLLPGHPRRSATSPAGTATATGCDTTGRIRRSTPRCSGCSTICGSNPIPEPMLSAFLPDQYDRVRAGVLSADPKEPCAAIGSRACLQNYVQACVTPFATLCPCLALPSPAMGRDY